MGLVDTSSHSSATDQRQGASDNARVFRGQGARYQEAGSIDFGRSRISEGNLTLSGIKGNITLGDNGAGVAAVSSTLGGVIQSLLGFIIAAPTPSPSGSDLGSSPDSASGAADTGGPTDAAWWTTQRKVMAAVLAGLLLLLIFKR